MWQGESSAETVRKTAGEFAQTLARARPGEPVKVTVKKWQ
jgi:antitoxin (DNA-binding transcriptional repressor) of toxin-antitoxin stability system